jgi:hypothetical protein
VHDPFVGTWMLNVEKSEFDPNHQPRAGTVVFELDAEGYFLKTAEGVNEQGEKCAERPVRFLADGQEHPLPNLPGLKYISTRPDKNTITEEAKREDGSIVGGSTSVVSPDGKSLTITSFGYDSQLRQFRLRTVWDRK